MIDAAKIEAQFWKFASTVVIPSKDEGLIPFRPWGTQRYIIHEVFKGLEEGIHSFVEVKPRQVGATTAHLVFDAFWLLKNPGLQGQFVADSDANKEVFRDLLTEVVKGLPTKFSWPVRVSNRTLMGWAGPAGRTGSRLMFQTAGAKFAKRVGRSRGLNFLHATEVAYWDNPDAIPALQNALSERHPLAVYIWESTANGYNHFYNMWLSAQHAVTTRAIFVPWWRHELYELKPKDPAYIVYWDGRLTPDEAAWADEIKRRWGMMLTPGQWAWWRWKLSERVGDIVQMHEDFPTLPEHAFQASGSEYLGHAAMARLRNTLATAPNPEDYRYTFGPLIEDMSVYPTEAPLAQLKVWESPEAANYYVVSADPAFGASEKSDRSVAQVWRATREGLWQVAEFCTVDVTMQQFAWVCMHLAGTYSPSAFILELSGPGYGVWQEIQRLQAWGWGTARRPELDQVLAGVQHYLYRRSDSLSAQAFLQWKSTGQNKVWIYSRLRDYILQGCVHPCSPDFVEELGSVRQDGDSFGADGKAHDDRVSAAAMAVEMWVSQVVPILHTLPPRGPRPDQQPEAPAPAHERLMQRFFEHLKAEPKR